jgi:hypothetical protein
LGWLDTDNYTPYQIDVILVWYKSGIEKYERRSSITVCSSLEEEGISLISITLFLLCAF